MKNILDLRFIISLFFGITGIILVIESFVNNTTAGKTETTNFWAGIVYVAFSILMLILWLNGRRKELRKNDSAKIGDDHTEV